MTKNFCKNCGFLDSTQRICLMMRSEVNPQTDFCSKFLSKSDIFTCPVCNNQAINVIYDTEFDMEMCPTCAKNLHKCFTCNFSNDCEFHNNADPMPKIVTKTVQHQMGYMQTQIANPERIKKYCSICKCYHEELGCLKQAKEFSCEKWEPLTVLLYHKK